MKATELKAVIAAVKLNVKLFKLTKGDNTLTELENFTPSMLSAFDYWYDMEVAKLFS